VEVEGAEAAASGEASLWPVEERGVNSTTYDPAPAVLDYALTFCDSCLSPFHHINMLPFLRVSYFTALYISSQCSFVRITSTRRSAQACLLNHVSIPYEFARMSSNEYPTSGNTSICQILSRCCSMMPQDAAYVHFAWVDQLHSVRAKQR
jgi:hypothetical protein